MELTPSWISLSLVRRSRRRPLMLLRWKVSITLSNSSPRRRSHALTCCSVHVETGEAEGTRRTGRGKDEEDGLEGLASND